MSKRAKVDFEFPEFPVVGTEELRLEALKSFDILDRPPMPSFDRITKMLCEIFDTPIALVSLVDENRQWFLSKQGLEAKETPRQLAFCNYVVADPGSGGLIVKDPTTDPRFRENPLVTGDLNIRFYAGAPLMIDTEQGLAAGSLCVIDQKRRAQEFTEAHMEKLRSFADIVVDLMNYHKSTVQHYTEQRTRLVTAFGHELNNNVHILVSGVQEIRDQVVKNELPRLDDIDELCKASLRLVRTTQTMCTPDQLPLLRKALEPTEVGLKDTVRDVMAWFSMTSAESLGLAFTGHTENIPEKIIVDQPLLRQVLENMVSMVANECIVRVHETGKSAQQKSVNLNCSYNCRSGMIQAEIACDDIDIETLRSSPLFDLTKQMAKKINAILQFASGNCPSPVFRLSFVAVTPSSEDSIMEDVIEKKSCEKEDQYRPASKEDRRTGEPRAKNLFVKEVTERDGTKPIEDLVIAVVDDEQLCRRIMKRLLCKQGVQPENILEFSDGDEVDPERIVEPDICFFDIIMRNMNGDKLCHSMRQDYKWKCPIIATTGNGGPDEQLLACGFNSIIRKPFSSDHIESTLQLHLGIKKK